MTIRCHLDRVSTQGIAGWAWDTDDSDVALLVDVFDGQRLIGSTEASRFRADLEKARFRNGHCAFQFQFAAGERINSPDSVRAIVRHPTTPAIRCELSRKPAQPAPDDGLIDFGADALAKLKPLGLHIGCLRGWFKLGSQTRFETPIVVLAQIAPGTSVQIGAFSGVYGRSLNRCSIGRYCSIAPNVVIGPNEHPINWLTTSVIAENPNIHDWGQFIDPLRAGHFQENHLHFGGNQASARIGNDVWLGDSVFVSSGATIGDGAVVGAGSVVVSDIPPYAIAVGAPAKVKRMRFDEKTIARLLHLQWWKYSLYDVSGTRFDRVDEALPVIEDRVANGTLAEYRPITYTPADLRTAFVTPAKS